MKKIIVYISVFTLLYSCETGRYVSDYKQIKKTIDTLVILKPMVVIDVKNYSDKDSFDIKLENAVSKILKDKANDLLNKKYIIKNELSDKEYSDADIKELISLTDKLKQSKKTIQGFIFPDINNKNDKTDYLLFIYLKGHYTQGISPYETLSEGESANLILGGGGVNLTPAKTANEEIGVFLLNKNKEVLYFNSIFSVNDPRLKELAERDFMKVIKSIYYK